MSTNLDNEDARKNTTVNDEETAAVRIAKQACADAKAALSEAQAAATAANAAKNEARQTLIAIEDVLVEGMVTMEEVQETAIKVKAIADEINRKCAQPPKPAYPKSSSTNKIEAEKCITIGHKAFDDKDYKKAEKFLLKAKSLDPNVDVEKMLADVQSIIKDKKETIEHYTEMANEAILCKDYRKAEKILMEALEFDPTADVKLTELKSAVEKKEDLKTIVTFLFKASEQARRDGNYIEAQVYLLKAKEKCPKINIDEALKSLQDEIDDQRKKSLASDLLLQAERMVQKRDYVQAEQLFMRVQQLNVGIDVEDKLRRVQKLKGKSGCVLA